jgi:hypothetical protein
VYLATKCERRQDELALAGAEKRLDAKRTGMSPSHKAGRWKRQTGEGAILWSEPIIRPKGCRQTIIEEVAAKATEAWGMLVTPRIVESCWVEFRQKFKK